MLYVAIVNSYLVVQILTVQLTGYDQPLQPKNWINFQDQIVRPYQALRYHIETNWQEDIRQNAIAAAVDLLVLMKAYTALPIDPGSYIRALQAITEVSASAIIRKVYADVKGAALGSPRNGRNGPGYGQESGPI